MSKGNRGAGANSVHCNVCRTMLMPAWRLHDRQKPQCPPLQLQGHIPPDQTSRGPKCSTDDQLEPAFAAQHRLSGQHHLQQEKESKDSRHVYHPSQPPRLLTGCHAMDVIQTYCPGAQIARATHASIRQPGAVHAFAIRMDECNFQELSLCVYQLDGSQVGSLPSDCNK